jgi:xylulokinase
MPSCAPRSSFSIGRRAAEAEPVRAVLGIDLGTTYFKAGLFSADGGLLGLGKTAVEAETGTRGRFEIPVVRFQTLLRGVIGQAFDGAGLPPRSIDAVSYSSQANSYLLLDGDARPLTPIVLWQDRRVTDMPSDLARVHARPDFLTVTGLGLFGPLHCVPKVLWHRAREPEIWRQTRMIMTLSDYLTYLMTGERAGDSGTASLLGIWNLPAGAWWREALEELGLDPSCFSRLAPPGTVIGRTGAGAAELFGLPSGVPFAVGGLDHHMAAIGTGVGRLASVSESAGTVLGCFAESARFAPRPSCVMGPGVPSAAPFYSLAFHDSGGVVLEWYRTRYANHLSFDELSGLAEPVPMGSEGLLCLPLADTFPDKEGFVSAGPGHGHGHFTRAIMESIAGELVLLLERLCGQPLPGRVLCSGGGARSSLWLRIKADLTGCEMVTTNYTEAACAGAAMLAASAARWFASPMEASSAWVRIGSSTLPDPDNHNAYLAWLERYRREADSMPSRSLVE